MKKNCALLIVFLFVTLCMAFAQQPIRLHKFPNLSSDTWFYRDTCRNVAGRFPGFSPFFMIYPDKACDSLQAVSLIKELGLEKYVRTYSGSVCVMNPMGAAYDNKADLDAFKECLERMRITTK